MYIILRMLMEFDGKFVVCESDKLGTRSGWLTGYFMEKLGFPMLAFSEVEVALMDLPETNLAPPHYHKIGTEITVATKGQLTIMYGELNSGLSMVELKRGQAMIIYPGIVQQNPKNVPETEVVVVKFPSIPGDKYTTKVLPSGISIAEE